MEALFIGLLCFFAGGLESPFRYYYFLSLICCALRHPPQITYATCALHGLSCGLLFFALPAEGRRLAPLALTLVVLGWVTWATGAMGLLLKRVGEPRAEIWPIGLREPLPRIGIPLRFDVDDVAVALQSLLDQVYDEGRYADADLIDYTQPPPPPPLPGDDARWVAEPVERRPATRGSHPAGAQPPQA